MLWINILHVLAFSIAGLIFLRECIRYHVTIKHAVILSIVSFVVFRIGSYVLFSIESGYWRGAWWEYMDFTRGGMSLYGGILVTFIWIYFYARFESLNFLKVVDVMAPAFAFGICVGKIGCFLEGCCYGFALEGHWSFLEFAGMKFFPTQLLESSMNFIVGLIVISTPCVDNHEGKRTGIFFLLYGATRFLSDFTRFNQVALYGLTMAQLYSVPLMLLGSALMYKNHVLLRHIYTPSFRTGPHLS